METLKLTIQQSSDISLLSHMYLELMEDEQADAKLTPKSANEKMTGFLNAGETAYVFTHNGKTVGYALVITNKAPVYLHHFYICRSARRGGNGTAAFHALMQTLSTDTIDLDVFVWNTRGQAFWTSLGFKPRATIMRYDGSTQ